MTTEGVPPAEGSVPPGLGDRGAALWRDLAGEVGADRERRELLLEACRAADTLDALHAESRVLGASVLGSRGNRGRIRCWTGFRRCRARTAGCW